MENGKIASQSQPKSRRSKQKRKVKILFGSQTGKGQVTLTFCCLYGVGLNLLIISYYSKRDVFTVSVSSFLDAEFLAVPIPSCKATGLNGFDESSVFV